MASLDVFKEVGKIADSDFLAMDVLPILWNFSLGPLLNLQQFQGFMALIKQLSTRIEQEQTRKLQELSTSNTTTVASANDFMTFGGISHANGNVNGEDADFESLVTGHAGNSFSADNGFDAGWGSASATTSPPVSAGLQRPSQPRTQSARASEATPAFSWSTPPPQQTSTPPPRLGMGGMNTLQPQQHRSLTPDTSSLNSFAALKPQNTGPTTSSSSSMNGWGASSTTSTSSAFSLPLQPSRPQQQQQSMGGPGLMNMGILSPQQSSSAGGTAVNWSAASRPAQQQQQSMGLGGNRFGAQQTAGSPYSGFGIAPPPAGGAGGGLASLGGMGMGQQQRQQQQQQQQQQQRKGLDQYESLL